MESQGGTPFKQLTGMFLLGAIVGGLTALLLAPKAGAELRTDIVEGTRKVAEKVRGVADRIKGKEED